MNAELLHELLARGVPWPLAREAVASVALDRDQTHVLEEREPPDNQEVAP